MFYANVSHVVGIKEERYYLHRVYTLYAFQCTGLDYAGPLFIKNNTDATLKVYILLFMCVKSRSPSGVDPRHESISIYSSV